jgi:hypothetical protein
MWSKEFGIDFKKKYYNFQRIIYHTKMMMKGIILNNYMQNICFVFDEIYIFLEKGVMDNSYNCNWSMCGNWY